MAAPWLASLKTIAHPVAGAVPALVVVLFAGVLALLGLPCGTEGRAYALAYADRFVDLAAVLVGYRRTGYSRPALQDEQTHHLGAPGQLTEPD